MRETSWSPFWWINPERRLPDDDRCVLVCITGKWGNVSFQYGYELAQYYPDGEWCVQGFEDMDELTVHAWAEIPQYIGACL